MAFPNVNPFVETFLETTRIFLFGKPFPALAYDPTPMGPLGGAAAAGAAAMAAVAAATAAGVVVPQGAAPPVPPPPGEFEVYNAGAAAAPLPLPPGPVERALRQAEDDGIFARIYGFSFEGHYYKMPRPLLFLVRGEGRSRVPEDLPGAGGARAFNTRFTGVEGKDWQFASDIRVWAVDKHDIAVCLDLEIGKYEQVLLEWMIIASQEDGGARTVMASRGTSMASRGTSMATRSVASFRSVMVGPHQER